MRCGVRNLGVVVLSLWVAGGPVYALDASDTLALWKNASSAEKTGLVSELLKQKGRVIGASSIVKCLDEASGIPAHADLTIKRVVDACEKEQEQPV